MILSPPRKLLILPILTRTFLSLAPAFLLLSCATAPGTGPGSSSPEKELHREQVKSDPAAGEPESLEESEMVEFVIYRGERVQDWCLRLEKEGVLRCSWIDRLAATETFPEGNGFLPPPGHPSRFEGMFFPGFYRMELEPDTDLTPNSREGINPGLIRSRLILSRLLQKTGVLLESRKQDESERPDQSGIPGAPPLNLYRKMILASMIEKESVLGREYPRIAEVFLRRLAAHDRLGSCPTVEYALGYHRPFLLFRDLELRSPYNVYKRKGLPPTPIAFFSPEALRAVDRPAREGNYFFVFNWVTGKHDFSRSGDEHMKKAEVARSDFIEKFGRGSLYRIVPGVFYDYGRWITPPPLAVDRTRRGLSPSCERNPDKNSCNPPAEAVQ